MDGIYALTLEIGWGTVAASPSVIAYAALSNGLYSLHDRRFLVPDPNGTQVCLSALMEGFAGNSIVATVREDGATGGLGVTAFLLARYVGAF
jgi:hypothetical protein